MVQIHKTFTDEQVRELMQRDTNQQIDENIIKELKTEQKIIRNLTVPLRTYNCSYIRDILA